VTTKQESSQNFSLLLENSNLFAMELHNIKTNKHPSELTQNS